MIWLFKEPEHEAIFGLFSFCPNKECIEKGNEKGKLLKHEFPPFENKIAIREKALQTLSDEQKAVMEDLKQKGISHLTRIHFITLSRN